MVHLQRYLTDAPSCGVCIAETEDVLHILRDCSIAQQVWESLVQPNKLTSFFDMELQQWLYDNLKICDGTDMWSVDFISLIWKLWCARNRYIFENHQSSPTHIIHQAFLLVSDIKLAFVAPYQMLRKELKYVRWTLPPHGTLKLNTNGSCKGNPGMAGAGGLIRDNSGQWIIGFTCNIGIASSIVAELWGIKAGLKLAWDLQASSIKVETDSALGVTFFNEANMRHHPLAMLLMDCKELINRGWSCFIRHILREGNQCADFLTKHSHDFSEQFKTFHEPPIGLCALLLSDSVGVTNVRL